MYDYDRRVLQRVHAVATKTAASNAGSIEEVAREWGLALGKDILKAIPARYKADRGEVDQSRDYTEVRCKGTSVRDLEVELVVGYLTDTFQGTTLGGIFWDEIGFRGIKTEIRLRNNEPGSQLIELVKRVVAQNERG